MQEVPIAENGEATANQDQVPPDLPILPLRGAVVFPGTVVPLTVRRPGSLRLVEESMPQSKWLGMVTQLHDEEEDPGIRDLHTVGVIGQVGKLVRQPDGGVILLVQMHHRIRLVEFTQTEPFFRARMEILSDIRPDPDNDYWRASIQNLRESTIKLLSLNPAVPEEAQVAVANLEDPVLLTDFLAGNLELDVVQKQTLLEQVAVERRVTILQQHINNQIHIAELQQKIARDVATEFSDSQRRAYLREQMRAIQKELGEEDSTEVQIDDLRKRLEEAAPPEKVMASAERELHRLGIIPPASPEHAVIVSYLEIVAELPWNKRSDDNLDLNRAREILDRDHYGLEKIKRRLVEYLAVRKLNPKGRGPILCFVGPPGVGKTSLGHSIAGALGRRFARISLGGIRDEAEIRGHRRTYIGSMPGRIIQELRRAGTRNPVFMLDEVDKLGADFRGDPSSALLEVLDPRQNNAFVDRYLDVPFDLSQTLFIATANYLEAIPPPLRDRMEVITLPGYSAREKLQIARRYLVQRQIEENGLKPAQCRWTVPAIRRIIEDYTREAGVRELERQIGSVCRALAADVAENGQRTRSITPDVVREKLGAALYVREETLRRSDPGVVNGLAYTAAGGEVLHIEALRFPGKGEVILTGQMGDVMKESVQAAISLVRSRAVQLGIDPEAFTTHDLHVHVPAGAVPKDGPSAGVAMFAAIASLYSNRAVDHRLAMTGEISLRGIVLPIGGLKEKSLAALRAGIRTVLIPTLNQKDLPDLPDEVNQKIRIVPVGDVDEVLRHALRPLKPPRR